MWSVLTWFPSSAKVQECPCPVGVQMRQCHMSKPS